MRDIVMPNGNETDFIRMALQLGYTELWFVYANKKDFYKPRSKVDAAVDVKNIQLTSVNKGGDNTAAKVTLENIRKTLEMVRPQFVFGVEESSRKDHIHQRGSGFNHILAKIAHDKNISFAFSLAQLRGKKPHEILGRFTQNIALCRKYKVDMLIGTFATNPIHMRGPNDIASLFSLLGMHPAEIKKALN